MTILVGAADGRHVTLGADRGSLNSYGDGTRSEVATEKVFCKGDWLVGAAGWWQLVYIVRHELELEAPAEHELDRYMELVVPGMVRELLDEHGASAPTDIAWALMFGYRGRLWVLDDSHTVEEPVHGMAATGTHPQLAIGAMWALRRQGRHRRELVSAGMQVVYELTGSAYGPPLVLSSDELCS